MGDVSARMGGHGMRRQVSVRTVIVRLEWGLGLGSGCRLGWLLYQD